MTVRVKVPSVKKIFNKLFAIEINHQNRLLHEYNRITGKSFENVTFDKEIVFPLYGRWS